ncbi:hypothetical protein CP8484711_0889, partial [Chlamydia psittaci 84-8471/1]
ELLIWNI